MADPTLHLPRLLCLHGGGVNAEVFRIQSRAILAALQPHFRLVFADGPFLCDPGPGIVPVFAGYGPFRRWLRWLNEQRPIDSEAAVDEIWYQLREAMERDDAEGATGEWVGLYGFSQGAKLAASLLFDTQVREAVRGRMAVVKGKWENKLGVDLDDDLDLEEPMSPMPQWRFAVLMAGRAPLVSLNVVSRRNNALVPAGEISEVHDLSQNTADDSHILRLPTVHVHGLRDQGLHLHRILYTKYCDLTTAALVEWDGEHRVPIKKADVEKVIKAILNTAEKAGALGRGCT